MKANEISEIEWWVVDRLGFMMRFGLKYNVRTTPLMVLAGHAPTGADILAVTTRVTAYYHRHPNADQREATLARMLEPSREAFAAS